MSFHQFWKIDTYINRAEDRSQFLTQYWSANKIIFDPVQMPQVDTSELGPKDGMLGVGCFSKDHPYSDAQRELANERLAMAGVAEALFCGVVYPSVVVDYKRILAPASIGRPNKWDCFCPLLFWFGKKTVSLGIEWLGEAHEDFVVPAFQPILVVSKK